MAYQSPEGKAVLFTCYIPELNSEKTSWLRPLKRWRSEGEATISLLKRKYGLDRCLLKEDDGTEAWVDISIFAHNLDKSVALIV